MIHYHFGRRRKNGVMMWSPACRSLKPLTLHRQQPYYLRLHLSRSYHLGENDIYLIKSFIKIQIRERLSYTSDTVTGGILFGLQKLSVYHNLTF